MIIAIMMMMPSSVRGGVVSQSGITFTPKEDPVIITVFPNPAIRDIYIRGENVDLHNALVQVIDAKGKAVEVLMRQNGNGYEIRLGKDIRAEILFIRIITKDGKSYSAKVIKVN